MNASPIARLQAKVAERKAKVEEKRKLYLSLSRLDNDIVAIDEEIKGILMSHFGVKHPVPRLEPSHGGQDG